MKKVIYLALSLCSISVVQAQSCNPYISTRTAPDVRYELVIGSGGSEVLDKQTGLIWQRCSLGQTWSGTTCTGTAGIYTWENGLNEAKALGKGYRLPNVKELHSLTESACHDAAINEFFFPNTPISRFWSASPDIKTNDSVWNVWFGDGSLETIYKNFNSRVRAVRAGQ